MTTDEKIKELVKVFKEAEKAALDADPGQDNDGGTCNLDSPAFQIKGMRQSTIEKAAKEAGLQVVDFTWFGGQKWYWLIVTTFGQANRRSRMSTAASKVLKDYADSNKFKNFKACQYQAMD